MIQQYKGIFNNIIRAPRLQTNQHSEEISVPSFPESIRIYLDVHQLEDLSFSGTHWHHSLQFDVILEGELEIHVNGSRVVLEKGDGLIINSDVLHCTNPEGNSNCVCYSFQVPPSSLCSEKDFILYGKYISPIVSDTEFTHLVLKRNIYWQGEMLEYFDRIFYLAESQNFAHELKIKTLLLEAWIVLLKNFDGLSSDCKESEQSASAARLKEMITFVQQNYREKITLGEIAQSANISNSECSRCFKKFLNTTPIEYVSQTRIGEACKLFENTDMKITAIAEMTGFADYSYFHRVFKKYAGCTPKEYQLKVKVYKENEILRK